MDAQTLLTQIGAANLMSLGAREFVTSETTNGCGALHFRVGRGNKLKVRIALEPTDTYAVEIWHCKGTNIFQIGETIGMVYADSIGRTVVAAVRAAVEAVRS